jgi:hypothetical protein
MDLSPPNLTPSEVESEVKAVEKPEVNVIEEPKVVETSPPMRAESNGDYKYGFEDCTPCHWDIKPLEGGQPDEVEAYNSRSQERFVGSMVGFNAALRA